MTQTIFFKINFDRLALLPVIPSIVGIGGGGGWAYELSCFPFPVGSEKLL
jgi:hypothetical protein